MSPRGPWSCGIRVTNRWPIALPYATRWRAAVETGELVKAEALLSELGARIGRQEASMSGLAGLGISEDRRAEIRDMLDQAKWNAGVLRGRLEMARGDYKAALAELLAAFDSKIVVQPEARIGCGVLLAQCYGELRLWDLAGQALEQCIAMRPDDPTLRRAAANAWQESGAIQRASERLDLLDDGSWRAALEMANLRRLAAASGTAADQDLSAMQDSLDLAAQRLSELPAEVRQEEDSWSLSLMQALHGNASDPSERLSRVVELAEQFPSVPEIQLAAIGMLASDGQIDEARELLEKFKGVAEAEDTARLWVASYSAEATIAMAQDEVEAAYEIFRQGIQEQPAQVRELSMEAADLAIRQRQPEVAFKFLDAVPEDQHDIASLMALPRVAAVAQNGDAELGIGAADFRVWEDALKRLEGDNGTHWKFVAIERLLAEARQASDPSSALSQAETRFRQIQERRPRWGPAIALGGRIAAAKGDRKTAIELLKKAIRESDNQLSDVLLLVSQLYLENRIDEAAEELSRISRFSDSIQQVSFWEIEIAQRKGNTGEGDGVGPTPRPIAGRTK